MGGAAVFVLACGVDDKAEAILTCRVDVEAVLSVRLRFSVPLTTVLYGFSWLVLEAGVAGCTN